MTILQIISITVKYEISINFHFTFHGVEECPLPVMKEKKGHQRVKEVGQKNSLINCFHQILKIF